MRINTELSSGSAGEEEEVQGKTNGKTIG